MIALPIYYTTQPTPIINEPTVITPLKDKMQVEQFMLSDTTDQHPYTADYRCGSFTADVIANASELGIEAHYIILKWDDSPTLHSIIRFPTIENGDVFVDATSGDWLVDYSFNSSSFNSFLMTNTSHYGFYNATVSMYGIKDDSCISWTANPIPTPSPTPTPTPTPSPTPSPTPTPTPCFVCSGCADAVESYAVGHIVKSSHGIELFYKYVCPSEKKFKNREEVKNFMLWDDTWIDGNCADYTEAVIKSAAECGYQAGWGLVLFTDDNVYHAFLVFSTIEDDLVLVDGTMGDWWIYIDEDNMWEGIHMEYGWSFFGKKKPAVVITITL